MTRKRNASKRLKTLTIDWRASTLCNCVTRHMATSNYLIHRKTSTQVRQLSHENVLTPHKICFLKFLAFQKQCLAVAKATSKDKNQKYWYLLFINLYWTQNMFFFVLQCYGNFLLCLQLLDRSRKVMANHKLFSSTLLVLYSRK